MDKIIFNREAKRKIQHFESKYGQFDKKALYGQIDDMELVEWEGEIETPEKLIKKLRSLEEIRFEYN